MTVASKVRYRYNLDTVYDVNVLQVESLTARVGLHRVQRCHYAFVCNICQMLTTHFQTTYFVVRLSNRFVANEVNGKVKSHLLLKQRRPRVTGPLRRSTR